MLEIDSQTPVFYVVTPVFNGASFIDDAIFSIINQRGPFKICYHIQDGGSTDGTIDKLKNWKKNIDLQRAPGRNACLEFSYSTQQDNGMYDAIGQAFLNFSMRDNDVMTWINADDTAVDGAFYHVYRQIMSHPEIKLLTGCSYEMDEYGMLGKLHSMVVYPTASLAQGLHDGRCMKFVSQEGTFWQAQLWNLVKGVNKNLKLAGDYDLWRRFAEHTDMYSVDLPLCTRRVHSGQLSRDIEKYYHEVDSLFDSHEQIALTEARQDYQTWRARSDGWHRGEQYNGKALLYLGANQENNWQVVNIPYECPQNAAIRSDAKAVIFNLPATVVSGGREIMYSSPFSFSNSYGYFGLGCYHVTANQLILAFEARASNIFSMTLFFRNLAQMRNYTISKEGEDVYRGELPPSGHERDCMIAVDIKLTEGANQIFVKFGTHSPDQSIIFLKGEASPIL